MRPNHTKFKPSSDVAFSLWLYRQDRLTDYSQIEAVLIHSLVHAADREGRAQMALKKILVVDDEPSVVDGIQRWLEGEDYVAVGACDGLQGLKEFFLHHPCLVIADILMPRMDGFELLRRIREVSEVPVIILSALMKEEDKVQGLSLGADDFLTKPIGKRELLARVEAALRRAGVSHPTDQEQSYSDGAITIDFASHLVYVQGQQVELTPIEYRLLCYLIRHAGKVVDREQILRSVWGPQYEGEDYVKWHLSRLRRKIERDPLNPELVLCVREAGYSYVPPEESSRRRAFADTNGGLGL